MESNNIIKVYDDDNNVKEYKLIAIYDNKYIIYKDINNVFNNQDIYASKIISNNEVLKLGKLTDAEWKILENEYSNLLEKN